MTKSSRNSDAASSAASFAEGANLPNEADLAGDLGVSRNVLREAVKVLVAKGMLDVRPKTGTTVRAKEQWHMLDPEVLAWEAAGDLHLPYAFNFTEFRLIVEPKASFLAAKRATDAEIQVIRDAATRSKPASAISTACPTPTSPSIRASIAPPTMPCSSISAC